MTTEEVKNLHRVAVDLHPIIQDGMMIETISEVAKKLITKEVAKNMFKKHNSYTYIIYAIVYIAIFASVGLLNFAILDWNPDALTSAEYWVKTATTSFTYFIAYQVTIGLSADIATNTDKLYNDTIAEIEKTALGKIDHRFNDFINEYNWRSKVQTWKELRQNDLVLWQNKLPADVLSELRLKPEQWSKKTIKYVQKRDAIKEKMSDAWINENLPFTKLIFPFITPQEVITGEEKPISRSRIVDNNVYSYKLGSRSITLITSVLLNAVINAVFFIGQPFNLSIITTIIIQLVFLAINILGGWIAGLDAFRRKRLNSAIKRREILIEYLSVLAKGQLDNKAPSAASL